MVVYVYISLYCISCPIIVENKFWLYWFRSLFGMSLQVGGSFSNFQLLKIANISL
jgi:hypothetical protein